MKNGKQKYRSKIRIYVDILQSLRDDPECKVTHVIHLANIPHDRLMLYLTQMENDGIIGSEEINGGKGYVITEKGKRLVDEFQKMQEWARAFGLEL